MKGIWRTNPNGPLYPDVTTFHKAGITRFYIPIMVLNPETQKYEPNTIELDPAYRHAIINDFYLEYAHYSDPSWTSLINPAEYIGYVVDNFFRSGAKSTMINVEYKDSDFVEECIRLLRKHITSGPLSWAMEPFQAGWMKKSLINVVNHDPNFVLVVENFFGNMVPAGTRNGKTPREELVLAGFASNRVKVFYDGAIIPLPSNWDGCILSEERQLALAFLK